MPNENTSYGVRYAIIGTVCAALGFAAGCNLKKGGLESVVVQLDGTRITSASQLPQSPSNYNLARDSYNVVGEYKANGSVAEFFLTSKASGSKKRDPVKRNSASSSAGSKTPASSSSVPAKTPETSAATPAAEPVEDLPDAQGSGQAPPK